eukprot:scaffold56428_cov20-Tisochrysis_lutea.AAC.1
MGAALQKKEAVRESMGCCTKKNGVHVSFFSSQNAAVAEYKPDLSDVEQVVARCRNLLLILTEPAQAPCHSVHGRGAEQRALPARTGGSCPPLRARGDRGKGGRALGGCQRQHAFLPTPADNPCAQARCADSIFAEGSAPQVEQACGMGGGKGCALCQVNQHRMQGNRLGWRMKCVLMHAPDEADYLAAVRARMQHL